MRLSRSSVIALIGLALAGAGIVAPILWDVYKSRAGLELRVLGTAILANDVGRIEKLSFTYSGKRISRLNKLDFALVNTGRSPIRLSDVLEAVQIHLDSGAALEARVERVAPVNVRAILTVDSSGSVVTISFPLLNPSDQIFFNILASDTPHLRSVFGRIAGISEVKVVDRSSTRGFPWRRVSPRIYLVTTFTLVSVLFLAGCLYVAGMEEAFGIVWGSGRVAAPPQGKPQDFTSFLDAVVQDNKNQELAPARSFVATLPPELLLRDDQREHFLALVSQAFMDRRAIIVASWLFFILSALGTWYVLVSLGRLGAG